MINKKYYNLLTSVLFITLLSSLLFGSISARYVWATTQLTVSGKWSYDDRDSSLKGTKTYLVQLLTGDNDHLGWSHTSAQSGHEGEYEFDPVDNPGAEGVKVRLYTGAYYGANNQLVCVDDGGSDYTDAYTFDTYTDYLEGTETTHYMGSYYVPDSLNEIDACWIKGDLQMGYDYPCEYPPKSYIAQWKHDWYEDSLYDQDTNIITISSYGAEDSPDEVLHEMGHGVMDNVYDDDWPPGNIPNPHYFHQKYNTGCAWKEGWATFWALAVTDDPVYNFPAGSDSFDFEEPSWGSYCSYYGGDWDNGDAVEGRVAGALWDIYDSVSDNCDQYYGGFDTTWDTLTGNTSDNFSQFWEAWKEENPDDRFNALQSIYQNTIPYSAEFEIDLFAGLNLMSLPLIPEETDPSVALNGLNCGAVSQYRHPSGPTPHGWVVYINGYPYDPESGFEWADGIGYWITLGDPADDLLMDGHVLDPYPDPPPAYEVYDDDWNLMGFTSTYNRTFEDYLDSILEIAVMVYGWNDEEKEYFAGGAPGHEYMIPGDGYWICVSDNGTIYPYGEGESKGRSGPGILDIRKQLMADPNLWNIDLRVNSSRSAFTSQVTFGVHPDATESYDIYLDGPAPPPPPMKELVEAYIWQPEHKESWKQKLSIEYSPPADTIKWTLKVELKSASRSDQVVTIKWNKDDASSVPKEYKLLLLDENGKELVNMREVNSYTFEVRIPKDAASQVTNFTIEATIK